MSVHGRSSASCGLEASQPQAIATDHQNLFLPVHYNRSRVQSALKRFLLGRAATGILGLAFFVLVVRTLEREEFGAYTALLALQAGVAVLATLGIEATLERFLPELRTMRDEGAVAQLILLGVVARSALLLLLACAAALTMDGWVPLLSLEPFRSTVPLALLWLVLFGLLSTCSAIHEALLNQGTAQLAQTLYSSIKTGLFLLLPLGLVSGMGLHRVMVCEALATGLALAVALATLRREAVPGLGMPRQAWAMLPEVLRGRMLRFGLKNYAAQLLMLLYGADALRLVASSQAGLAQTGRFGAVHSLYEYVQRYLPAFMLMRLIRPVFVSRYTATKDFQALNAMASMVLKANLLVLTPLLVFFYGAGDLLLGALSKGRYTDAGALLVAYVALLVPLSNQWVVSVVANTTEQNDTQVKAALFAVPGIAIGAWFTTSHGVAALVVGAWCSALAYNAGAVLMLRRAGLPMRIDWRALALCGVCGVMSCAVLLMLAHYLPVDAGLRLALAAAIAGLSLLAVLLAGLFTTDERQTIRSLLQRRQPMQPT